MFRYSIEGCCGGVIVADNADAARIILYKKYDRLLSEVDSRGSKKQLIIWDVEKDDYYDEEFPQIIECYGE